LPARRQPFELVEVPQLLPLPGQLKPMPSGSTATPDAAGPLKRVKLANELARVEAARPD
jgi:type IV secretion system protein VirB9